MISAAAAAEALGVSTRTIYDLAAPAGPIPCYRIGRRLVFALADVLAFQATCRHTQRKLEARPVASAPRLKVADPESGLLATFRKLGVKPKLHY